MSQLTEKRCPLCGSYIKLHTGDVHSFDRVCAAMNAQAELAALKDAVKPVVVWYVRSKREFPADFTNKSIVLHYEGRDGVENVTGAQFDALAKLVREGECQK